MPTYLDTLDKFTLDKIHHMASILLFKDVMFELLFKSQEGQLKYYITMSDLGIEWIDKYYKSINKVKKSQIIHRFMILCSTDDKLREYTIQRIEKYKTIEL